MEQKITQMERVSHAKKWTSRFVFCSAREVASSRVLVGYWGQYFFTAKKGKIYDFITLNVLKISC